MSFINEDMANWGNGRYKKFYFDLMKLKVDEVALMNMMLCSATPVGGTKNAYSKQTLENCYNRFTRSIILELNGLLFTLPCRPVLLPSLVLTSTIADTLPPYSALNPAE